MIYDCLSVDIGCFTKTDRDRAEYFEDTFSIFQGVKVTRPLFLFHLIDVGPFEAFEHFNVLLEVVRSIKAIDFTPRLLTSGKYFKNVVETSTRFQELKALGVTKIALRLDKVAAESLPNDNVISFVKACGDCGISPDVIFELENSVPESLFRLLRLIEQTRFYTDLYTRIKVKPKLSKFTINGSIKDIRTFRVVVNADGDVSLRTHERGAEEINVGSLRSMLFQEIVDPKRLGIQMRMVSNGAKI